MIRKIKENESYIYLVMFIIALITKFEALEIISVLLFLIYSFRNYFKQKSLQNYLTFLAVFALVYSIIIKNYITDYHINYYTLFFVVIFIISFTIKKFLETKIHYNQKFWGFKSFIYLILVFFIVSIYHLSFGNFPPSFTGKNVHIENNKYSIFYDDEINKKDIEILNNTLIGFDYLYERDNTSFRITDDYDKFKFELYYPKEMWMEETTDELFKLYQDSLNNIGLSKNLKISLVAINKFSQIEKIIE